MKRLRENHAQVAPVCAQLLEVLADAEGRAAVVGLVATWTALAKLEKEYAAYVGLDLASSRSDSDLASSRAVEKHNRAQHKLRAAFDPFFAALHEGLKHLDRVVRAHEKTLAAEAAAEGKRATADRKTKALKTALETLHAEVKNAESCFAHIRWFQERFPEAAYEDVTGLCKLATPAEVAEQEFSVNPGRYVGVVIEEDGKTEEEFLSALLADRDELSALNSESLTLEKIISENLGMITGEKS
jgi:type I restriction enzyme M protein